MKHSNLFIAMICSPLLFSQSQYGKASFKQFKDDTDVYLNLKTVYYPEIYFSDVENRTKAYKFTEAAQGFGLNYISGYMFDTLGIELALYANAKLVTEYDDINNLGPRDGTVYKRCIKDKTPCELEPFSGAKLGKAIFKMRFGDEISGLQFDYGWMELGSHFIATSDNRATPATSQAGKFNANFSGMNLYGIYTNRLITRNSIEIDHYYAGSEIIPYLAAIGISSEGENWSANFEFAKSANLKQQLYLGLNYEFAMGEAGTIGFPIHLYSAQGKGKLWNAGNNTFDLSEKSAGLYNINAVATFNNVELALSYTTVNAKDGIYDYTMSDNDTGSGDALTFDQYSDFNFDKEEVFKVGITYTFEEFGLPDFYIYTSFTKGTGMNQAPTSSNGMKSEQEIDTAVGYTMLDGTLTLSLEHGYWTSTYLDNHKETDSNPRVFLTYKLDLI